MAAVVAMVIQAECLALEAAAEAATKLFGGTVLHQGPEEMAAMLVADSMAATAQETVTEAAALVGAEVLKVSAATGLLAES